jgi:hypothetical protein
MHPETVLDRVATVEITCAMNIILKYAPGYRTGMDNVLLLEVSSGRTDIFLAPCFGR